MLDFKLNFKGDAFRILQLTDMQIIDATQQRFPGRLKPEECEWWQPENMDKLYYSFVDELLLRTKPDLIVITGDIVYGQFDDTGRVFSGFVKRTDSYGIPWAPVWGNHDNESTAGVASQIEKFKSASNCLFEKGDTDGTSNYTIGIMKDGSLLRTLYMLDSNGCNGASESSLKDGVIPEKGITENQKSWLLSRGEKIASAYGKAPAFSLFHINTLDVYDALLARGLINDDTYRVRGALKADLGFGTEEFGKMYEPCETSKVQIRDVMKKVGIDGVFLGHQHKNNLSFTHDGIRYTWGTKTGYYDYHAKDMHGGTVIDVLPDGRFSVKHEFI